MRHRPKLLVIALSTGKVPTPSIAADFGNDIPKGKLILAVGKRFGHRDNLEPALNDRFLVAPDLSYFDFALGCQSCRCTQRSGIDIHLQVRHAYSPTSNLESADSSNEPAQVFLSKSALKYAAIRIPKSSSTRI